MTNKRDEEADKIYHASYPEMTNEEKQEFASYPEMTNEEKQEFASYPEMTNEEKQEKRKQNMRDEILKIIDPEEVEKQLEKFIENEDVHQAIVKRILEGLQKTFQITQGLGICPVGVILDVANNLAFNGLLNLDEEDRKEAIAIMKQSAEDYGNKDWLKVKKNNL